MTGPTATAGIFSTYPADCLSVWGGVVDQVTEKHFLHLTSSNDQIYSNFVYLFVKNPWSGPHLDRPVCTYVTVPMLPGDRHGRAVAVCPGSGGPEEWFPP